MNQEVRNYVMEKTQALIDAATCAAETRTAAHAWLAAAGTEKEAEQTRLYVAELEEDIMPIENLIQFAGSDAGIQYFGAETAKGIVEHATQIQANGAKYCDCPACAAVEAILVKKNEMLQ